MSDTYGYKTRMASLAVVCLAVAGCNAAIGEAQREQIVAGCQSTAASSGLPEGQIQQFCNCTADKMIEEKMTVSDAMDKAKAEQVAQACVTELISGGPAAAPAPAAQ